MASSPVDSPSLARSCDGTPRWCVVRDCLASSRLLPVLSARQCQRGNAAPCQFCLRGTASEEAGRQRSRIVAKRVIALKAQSQKLSKAVPLQGLYDIVRLCISSTFSHLLRTVYPSVIRPYAQRVDAIVTKAAFEAGGLTAIASTDPSDLERQRAAARLFVRIRLGGMGLYSCVDNSLAAFLGSAALTCETVRDLSRDTSFDPAKPNAAELPYVREHLDAIEQLKRRLPDCAEIQNWTLHSVLGASRPRLQAFIGEQLAKVARADVLAAFPDTDAGRQARAEFEECSEKKAGAWLQARALDPNCVLNNAEFWIAFGIRVGLAHRLYPEVSPHAVCKACKRAIGPSVPAHAFSECSKARRRGQNLRHTALKNAIATVERLSVAGTHIIMEPFVTATTGAVPTDAKFAKSRADVFVRPPGSLGYIVDATIVDATLGLEPAPNTSYEAGKATEQAFDEKVTQYTSERFTLDKQRFRAAAFDFRGAPSKSTLVYMKEIKHREIKANPKTPRSVIACRLYQRISVAIQRAIAYNVMEYRLWRVPVAVPVAAA